MAIVAAVALLALAWKTNFLGIQDITSAVFEAIKAAIDAAITWIMTTIEPFLAELRKFWDENGAQILAGLKLFWDGIKIVFSEAFEYIKMYVGTAWDIISGVFSAAFEVIKGVFKVFFEAITGILTVGMQILNGDWSGAWETVKNTLSNIGATIVETGKAVFEKLENTIKSVVERVENYVKGALQRIKDTLKEIVTLGQANTETYNGASSKSASVPARAFGGGVYRGQATEVGEHGRELFIPASDGRIVNAQQTAGMSG